MARIVCVGECMLELTGSLGSDVRLRFGGDTLNTAIYLARRGHHVRYLTALGADPYSADMCTAWASEGIDLSLVLTDPERLPGLYAVRTGAGGERSFAYWRSESAARQLFALPAIEAALVAAEDANLLYLSGITLSLFDVPGREKLADLAAQIRKTGGDVAFDPNYRSRQWPDPLAARHAIERFAARVSVVLPTFSDEHELFGDCDAFATIQRWVGYGVREVVVKLGEKGCLLCTDEGELSVPPKMAITPVDTTGAGDAFNAAYLDARLRAIDRTAAASRGNDLAGRVIGFTGAIAPE